MHHWHTLHVHAFPVLALVVAVVAGVAIAALVGRGK